MSSSEGRARRIARNTAVLYGSELLSRLCTWGLTAYLARAWTDVSSYGQYALLVNWITMAVVMSDLGLSVVTVREVAKQRDRANYFLSHVLVLRVASAFLLWGALEVAAVVLHYEPALRWGLTAMGLRIVFDCAAAGYGYLLQAHDEMSSFALQTVLGSVLRFVGIVAVVMLGGSVVAASLIWSVVSAISLVVLVGIGRRRGWSPQLSGLDFRESMRLFRLSIPLAAFGALQMFYYRVDAVMLKSLSGNVAVGFYDLASRILFVVLVFAQLYSNALFPTMSALQDDPAAFGRFVIRSGKVQLLLGIPLAVGGYFLATQLMMLIGGEKYASSGPLFAILAVSIVPFFLSTIYTDVLAIKNPKRLNGLFVLLLALNVVLNWWWIPSHGASGAAWATVTCELLGVPLGFWLAWPYLREGRAVAVVRPVVGSIAAAALMGAGLWWRPSLIWILVGPIIYGLGLWAFQALEAEEWGALRAFVQRKRAGSAEVGHAART